jgi:DNA-binding NarL/FixJ family response regulator
MLRIVIYEDNDQLRKSIQLLLHTQTDYEVVGSFEDANEIVGDINQLKPDLVILDIDMPGRKGTEAVALVKAARPETFVVMHTVFEEDEKLFASLCAGANGYILKKTAPQKFLQYIDEVVNAGAPFSPGIAQKVLKYFQSQPQAVPDFHLTEREKQILQLLIQGHTYKAS